jgi:Flp pilus assembly protein CpaB
VATAALGSWWITTGATGTPSTSYVVAARSIDPGQRIEAQDLRLATLTLPPAIAATAFTDTSPVSGSIALGPIGAGGLLQRDSVAPSTGTRTGRELSFAVETPWAVDGALRPGDRIDVFATTTEGVEARTTKVLAGVLVRHLSNTGGGLGEPTGMTITVAVPATADASRAVSALRGTDLTVARATGVLDLPTDEPAASSSDDRGDPIPRSTTTTVAPRSAGTAGRAATTTTVRNGAGR